MLVRSRVYLKAVGSESRERLKNQFPLNSSSSVMENRSNDVCSLEFFELVPEGVLSVACEAAVGTAVTRPSMTMQSSLGLLVDISSSSSSSSSSASRGVSCALPGWLAAEGEVTALSPPPTPDLWLYDAFSASSGFESAMSFVRSSLISWVVLGLLLKPFDVDCSLELATLEVVSLEVDPVCRDEDGIFLPFFTLVFGLALERGKRRSEC